jgi:hypothetical protein
MPYYEIVYEPGNHSLAHYESDEEATNALNAHHERAKTGEAGITGSGGPEWPAERIARVFVYDNHPADFGVGQKVKADDVISQVSSMADADGLVNAPEAAAAVRASTSPFVEPSEAHGSIYAMPETHELNWENA